MLRLKLKIEDESGEAVYDVQFERIPEDGLLELNLGKLLRMEYDFAGSVPKVQA